MSSSHSITDVNIFLTLQELTIFKFTFLVSVNALLYLLTDITFIVPSKFKGLIVLAFLFIIGLHVLALFLNVTKLWLKPWMRIPTGIIFILFYLGFIAVNVLL